MDYSNFYKYEVVRRSGAYNMITEAPMAAKAAGLTIKQYTDIIKRYQIIYFKIQKEFGSVDKFMEEYDSRRNS